MIEVIEVDTNPDEHELFRQRLLWNVKREVKQIMEEAVMKKCIHEDNCSIITLSSAVEACLIHGLKRRAVGLFKTSTTMALLQKIAKTCPSAAEVVKMVDSDNRRSTESTNIFSFSKKLTSSEENHRRSIRSAMHNRYLWIRTALVHRSLHKIVEYIVNSCSKYYESYALVYNSVQGPIFASLLVGPCALEFTRLQPSDHLWTDPNANELVQRHRMHSGNRATTVTMKLNSSQSPKFLSRLQMHSKRQASSSSEDFQRTSQMSSTSPNPAKDYVESLHQNAKSQLIYGKNNVLVQPISGCDPIPGYLSLHLYQTGLTLKWTPNQLMNGCNHGPKAFKNSSQDGNNCESNHTTESSKRADVVWDYAISVNMSSIVYLHCHQHVDGDRIVLVGCDGVQYPPLHIKDKGGHLLAFLSCLEAGLAPHGQLDPPLCVEKDQGKTFPKIHHHTERNCMSSNPSEDLDSSNEETSPTGDYVFRIVFSPELETTSNSSSTSSRWPWSKLSTSSQSSSLSPSAHNQTINMSLPASPIDATFTDSSVEVTTTVDLHKSTSVRTCMASLCDTMRRQILSRTFYGWLAYCRHIKTVRTHLATLVYPISTETSEQLQKNLSLTVESWTELFLDKQKDNAAVDGKSIYQRIYCGGCDPSIRKQVWPFLFSHYSFESTNDERMEIDRTVTDHYHKLLDEWKSAEEIIIKINTKHSIDCKKSITYSEAQQTSNETVSPSPKHVPAKNLLPTEDNVQRTDSTVANDVFDEECPVHTVTIPVSEETPQCTIITHPSVLIARTHTESIIDRSSPYNVIDTNTDDDDDSNLNFKTIDNDEMASTEEDRNKLDGKASPAPSVASTADIYMDAIETMNDESSSREMTPIHLGSFSNEIIDSFSTNLHRIDKDVARCDRNYLYFMNTNNLQKLRNIMCTYVWDNLTVGYIQGMCDLVAPLLVVFDEEIITYSCFCHLMKRLLPNFPNGTGMDEHFGHLRSLLQILDSELYEHIHRTGDFTHFYFCYRWFLLDFKREFTYDDLFVVWEIVNAARRTVSKRFVLFIALAMMKYYRDIILDNRMNFTDVIKFFNEMAERHDAQELLRIARELVLELQKLIDNK